MGRDLSMPEMTGAETIAELERLRVHVPVILSSAYDEHEALGAREATAVCGFLRKPYAPEELLRLVDAGLRRGGSVEHRAQVQERRGEGRHRRGDR